MVKEIWPPIIEYAEKKGVKIAIENCPMLFTQDEWPGGQNLMTFPANWRKVFEILDSENFGINYDPSHFVWQQIDYIKPLYEFRNKIFHVHYKDIKLFQDRLADVGILAAPLEYMSPKLPVLGDVDWGKYVSALTDILVLKWRIRHLKAPAKKRKRQLGAKNLLTPTSYNGTIIKNKKRYINE